GFSRLSANRRKWLRMLFLTSLAVHVVGLAIFGGYVVMHPKKREKPIFVTPPPIKTYEPRKLEHRVKVRKKQRSSSRPSLIPRLVSMKPSNISLPKIEMDPKLIHTSFQPKFKAVSGMGMGVGLGTGYGLGGFGTGVSNFNFFGIRGRGDKIAILLDVSVSMVEEGRGGPAGFMRVKQRVAEVVTKLDEAGMFNVIAFADAARTWKRELLIGNEDNRNQAKNFIFGFNTEGNYGLKNGNVGSMDMGIPAVGGGTRLDLALTAAFLQGADTILVISDGLPRVERGMDANRAKEHQLKMANWNKANANAMVNAGWVDKKVWVAGHDGKLREGGPTGPKTKGHWEVKRVRTGMPKGRPKEPKTEYWTLQDFLTHFEKLFEKYYQKKGKKRPVVHCIGYQIDRDGGRFLKKLAHTYKGNYRRVASLR
ncbi:MAG: VWA domain-containing protein, partial [Lentisphaeria bacterium]|nr:VWA domain-containing protein [Lentisphaeria bacterium]